MFDGTNELKAFVILAGAYFMQLSLQKSWSEGLSCKSLVILIL